MDDGAFNPDSTTPGTFLGTAMDLDFMDELLYDGCWVETADKLNFLQPGTSIAGSLNDPKHYFPLVESTSSQIYGQVSEKNFIQSPMLLNFRKEELIEPPESHNQNAGQPTTSSIQSEDLPVGGNELGRRLWIGPKAVASTMSPVKDRLMHAIWNLKECTEGKDVLIQIWVPIKKGGKHVLTTINQPYLLDPKSLSLASYRTVSKEYQFPADEDSKESVGLPGRVFLRKLPEWTPDVRFFRSYEYPRKPHAKQYNISGSLAVPVFEQASGTCLGVVEVVTTTQKISYRPELETVCKALEAVDLRSSQDFFPPTVKVCREFCEAAVPHISEILGSVCMKHSLPLALTWAPFFQGGKGGSQHFDSYSHYISTVDSACFVSDKDFLQFYMACSEQDLYLGQGIVGRAFATNKQCFAADITVFSKTDYPLSHHARMLGLRAAIAIPLRSTHTGLTDFVLELFLPKDCQNLEEQKRMWDLLPISLQQASQTLHVVMDKYFGEDINYQAMVNSDGKLGTEESQKLTSSSFKEFSLEESSQNASVMKARQKGKDVCVSQDFPKEESKEEFEVKNYWDKPQGALDQEQVFKEVGKLPQNYGPKGGTENSKDSSFSGRHSLNSRRAGEKRRTKTEKTISLEVLRQYFAGSLKDAAKSIGVCPTTLKRICRQHGITRWPSRKIKKVGHSLKKLQLVIDSVQGAEGSIQIGSFYSTFPELTSPKFSGNGPLSSFNINEISKELESQPESHIFSTGATTKSPSSSCSQSSGSSICCSTGAKQQTTASNALSSGDALTVNDSGNVLKRTHSDAALHALNREERKLLARSHSHKTFDNAPNPESLPPLPKSSGRNLRDGGGFRVKATFGGEKIRFSLQPNWVFVDLQQELAKRFNIDDISRIDLKYLDDDHEWVLLTCDADLEECQDIYRLTQSHTIKISLHEAAQAPLGSSFGS